MKLVNQYFNQSNAYADAEKLKRKGIKVFVSSINSHQLSRSRTGALKVGLWVVYNFQLNDAIACLKDNKHKVVYKFPKDIMSESSIQNSLNKSQASNMILKVGIKIIFVIGLVPFLFIKYVT